MSRLKYALIGHGRRGAAHLSTAAMLKDTFDIVSRRQLDAESAEIGAAKYGVKAYTDVRKMIDEMSPDVCDVVVPIPLQPITPTRPFAISISSAILLLQTTGNRKPDGYEINYFAMETIIYRVGLEVKFFVGDRKVI